MIVLCATPVNRWKWARADRFHRDSALFYEHRPEFFTIELFFALPGGWLDGVVGLGLKSLCADTHPFWPHICFSPFWVLACPLENLNHRHRGYPLFVGIGCDQDQGIAWTGNGREPFYASAIDVGAVFGT